MAQHQWTRREFLAGSACGVAVAGLAGCATGPLLSAQAHRDIPCFARLQVKHPANFRILQLTDLHFGGGEVLQEMRNRRTAEMMIALVKLTKPDLVMATGDLWPENRDNRGEEFMRYAVAQCEALGVPWAFTWGNHDQLPDLAAGHEAFTKARNSCYRGAPSNGNYVIDLVGHHDRVLSQIICVNTGQDGLLQPQQQWLLSMGKATTATPPRFAFFHIPLKQYDDMWTSGVASGIKGEPPCIEKEDGAALAVLKDIGVRACFCGHDHVNDYAGVVDGVELVYGRAASGYGGTNVPKGGKLITLNCRTGRYAWLTVLPDGTTWHPQPGERIDKTGEKH